MSVAFASRVVDGVLALDKPEGWTSHDVVAKVRGIFRGGKVGHAGTLDPAATGVLPMLIGQGTRIAEYLVEWDKEYRAVLRLGSTTDTQDATGVVLVETPVPVLSRERIEEVARRFVGTISQIPPMYSAVKVAGVPLYRSAREGRVVAREPRVVTMHALTVVAMHGTDIELHVHCSKGTYIRTLCADLGEALGCGGHLLSLRRTRVGPLTLDHALNLDEVERLWPVGALVDSIFSVDQVLSGAPAVLVDESVAGRVMHGVAVPLSAIGESAARACRQAGLVRIKDPRGRLLAIGSVAETGGVDMKDRKAAAIRIRKVLAGQA
ncbi:tRNA pseudouridine synthase B [Nitrospira sp.]|nr:tRNA pseudouridine synthase B [Nitrospira sp.]